MTREQAELLVAQMIAAWPWASWPDTTVLMYRQRFESMAHVDLGQQVVEKAILSLERPPSIAALHDAYQPLAKVRDWRPPPTRDALPPSSREPLAVIGDVLAGSEIGRWLLERRRAAEAPEEPNAAGEAPTT